MDKCFCHLNGLMVKDATARKNIEELNQKVNLNTETLNTINNKTNKILFKSESIESEIPGGDVSNMNLFLPNLDKYSLVLVDGFLCSVAKFDELYKIRGFHSSGIPSYVPDGGDMSGAAITQTTIEIVVENQNGNLVIKSNESYECTRTNTDWAEDLFRLPILEIIGVI